MDIKILQNGMSITNVKPNTPIELWASSSSPFTLLFPFIQARFYVENTEGRKYLDEQVSVNVLNDAWYDWISPAENGTYYFYPNYPDKSDFMIFTVDSGALIPGNNSQEDPAAGNNGSDNQPQAPQIPANWTPYIIGGAVLFAVLLLSTGSKK